MVSNSILLVEDNRWHRKIYSSLLRAHGFRPVEIIDPKTAFAAAQQGSAAAILIDILLPQVDGRHIIGQLRADPKTQNIPIMAISAGTDRDMAETCLAAGADLFRSKPVPLLTLVSDIQQLVQGN